MNRDVGGLNENIGPNASHQILLADQLSVAFKQSNQDFPSATSERHGVVDFQQKELGSKQAKRPNEAPVDEPAVAIKSRRLAPAGPYLVVCFGDYATA